MTSEASLARARGRRSRASPEDEALCSPSVAAALMRRLASVARDQDGAPNPIEPLTTREREILELIDEGLSNKQIAQRLRIELPTVKNHVHRTFSRKLRVQRRAEAAAIARTAVSSPALRREGSDRGEPGPPEPARRDRGPGPRPGPKLGRKAHSEAEGCSRRIERTGRRPLGAPTRIPAHRLAAHAGGDRLRRPSAPSPGLEITGTGTEPRRALPGSWRRARPDIVVLGGDDPTLAAELLGQSPRLKVLAVADEGQDSWLYGLRPERTRLGDLSPTRLARGRPAGRPLRMAPARGGTDERAGEAIKARLAAAERLGIHRNQVGARSRRIWTSC